MRISVHYPLLIIICLENLSIIIGSFTSQRKREMGETEGGRERKEESDRERRVTESQIKTSK
jgi:hypothetical protein